MRDYVLSCCSTADLTHEHLTKRNISYICFSFTLNGQVYLDDLGKSISYENFYYTIASGADARTSQINVSDYLEYFSNILKEGKDILHICLSTGLSGTYNSACSAAAVAKERYPDRKIYIVDSLGGSSGYGLLMELLADKADEGYSIDELYKYANDIKLKIHHWFFSTDLSSYVKGGRISKTAGFVGGILGICPLLNVNTEGRLIPRENIRTKKRVIKEIVKKMEQYAKDGHDYNEKCFISHSNCLDDAIAVRDLVEERFPNLKGKILINYIGTTIGCHTGVGTVALFFVGDHRE